MATFKNKDQAEHLRTEAQKAESFDFGTSSLPSRKEVHGKKKQKIKWRIKYPLLKILTFFFILTLLELHMVIIVFLLSTLKLYPKKFTFSSGIGPLPLEQQLYSCVACFAARFGRFAGGRRGVGRIYKHLARAGPARRRPRAF